MSTPTADPLKKKKGLLSRGKTVRPTGKDKPEKTDKPEKKSATSEKVEKVDDSKKPESKTLEKKLAPRTKTTDKSAHKDKTDKEAKPASSTSSSTSGASKSRQMTRRTGRKTEMPKDPEEVRKMFEEVLVCRLCTNHTDSHSKAVVIPSESDKRDMRKMGVEAQWVFIQSNKARLEDAKNQNTTPASLAKSLADPARVDMDIMKKLKSEVNTATGSWLDEFRQEKGILNLVEVLVHQSNNKNQVRRTAS